MDPALQIELIKAFVAGMGAIGAVAAAILGWINRKKIHEVKILVNGRLDAMIAAAHAQGRLAEREGQPAKIEPVPGN